GSLDFSYESGYGTIRSAWSFSGKTAVWKLTIPPNATGRLPLTHARSERFTLNGKPLAKDSSLRATLSGDQEVYELPAGTYRFEVKLPYPGPGWTAGSSASSFSFPDSCRSQRLPWTRSVPTG